MPEQTFKDRNGRTIIAGDRVRVIGLPDLSGMSEAGLRETLPVFRYLLGRYERVVSFDERGNAQLVFSIPRGALKGWHAVMIEPILLHRPIQPRLNKRPGHP